jgi:hypothetical protein
MGMFDRYAEEMEKLSDDDRVRVIPMFGGARMGTWTVDSEKDARWNNSGRAVGLVCEGGPKEMQDWIDECKKKYGKPPDDLDYIVKRLRYGRSEDD